MESESCNESKHYLERNLAFNRRKALKIRSEPVWYADRRPVWYRNRKCLPVMPDPYSESESDRDSLYSSLTDDSLEYAYDFDKNDREMREFHQIRSPSPYRVPIINDEISSKNS